MYFTYEVQEPAVPSPQACIAGLNDFAAAIEAGGLELSPIFDNPLCFFDTGRQAGRVSARYFQFGGHGVGDWGVLVSGGGCQAFILGGTTFVNMGLTDAEQAACAPLAIDILPGVDETNCNISLPPP